MEITALGPFQGIEGVEITVYWWDEGEGFHTHDIVTNGLGIASYELEFAEEVPDAVWYAEVTLVPEPHYMPNPNDNPAMIPMLILTHVFYCVV